MNKFDFMGKDALSKVEELVSASRLNEFLHKKEEEENRIIWKISRTILTTTSTTISLRMRTRSQRKRRRRKKRKNKQRKRLKIKRIVPSKG